MHMRTSANSTNNTREEEKKKRRRHEMVSYTCQAPGCGAQMSLWEKMRGCPRANEHEKLAIAYYAELAKAHNAAAATQAETEERVNAPTSTDVIDDDKALEEMLWASNKAALAIWTRDQDQALEAELHRREEAELAQQASEKEEWEDLIRSQVLAWIESGGYAPSNPPQVSGDMPAQTKSEEVKEAKSSSPREDTGDKTVTAPAVVRALALAPAPAAPAASTYMGELEAEKVKLLEEISRLNPVKHVSWLNLKLRQIEELRQEMRRLEDQPALATPKELDWSGHLKMQNFRRRTKTSAVQPIRQNTHMMNIRRQICLLVGSRE